MDDQKVAQCKRITVDRFLSAITYTLLAQLAPVTIFLLFVNTNLLHPITWLLDTTRLVFSVFTWIYMIPLIVAVAMHGVVWSKVFLSRKNYYNNRFLLFLNTCTKKTSLLLSHALVGLVTAWIFVKILNWKAASAGNVTPEARSCLLLCGVFMGSYHFVRNRLRLVQDVEFPLIQQRRFLRVRDQLYSLLQKSFFTALMPSVVFVSLCLLLLPFTLSEFHIDQMSVSGLLGNWKLLVYVWILASQILSNVQFMEQLFVVFLTEGHTFPVQGTELTLAEAINAENFKIIQELGSLDLFTLSENRNKLRRKELFSLSIPGGHPYNWTSVFEATTKNVGKFSKDLVSAMENIQSFEKTKAQSPTTLFNQQQKVRSASQLAEKILQRQMNENTGIRNMSHIYPGDGDDELVAIDPRPKFLQRLPMPQEIQGGLENCLNVVRNKLMALPGVSYFLAEQHYARVHFVLKESQRIVWLLQGISALTCCSITEDEYGIVQRTLPTLVAQLLELKGVVDKVETICDRQKLKRHQKALRSAVKRSLYNIASTFGDYLNDLILPDADREALMSYVLYKEN